MACLPRQVLLTQRFLTPRRRCSTGTKVPATPQQQRLQAVASLRFGLFPVRSPLLGESRLISVPLATEMFHFARSSAHGYVFTHALQSLQLAVALFGYPRVKVCSRLTEA